MSKQKIRLSIGQSVYSVDGHYSYEVIKLDKDRHDNIRGYYLVHFQGNLTDAVYVSAITTISEFERRWAFSYDDAVKAEIDSYKRKIKTMEEVYKDIL